MDDSEQPTEKVSKYNSALDQLQRIGELYRSCHIHAFNGDYRAWNEKLDSIWRELSGDLDPDEKEDKKTIDKLAEINKKIVESLPFEKPSASGFNKIKKKDIEKFANQKNLLSEKEIFLRFLQNTQGKGSSYKDPRDEGFD